MQVKVQFLFSMNSKQKYFLESALHSTAWFRASSYEPDNRAGSVTGTNFVVCSYGKFQPSRPGWNPRNKTKMVQHKLVPFAAVVALWTLVSLLIKLIRMLLKWTYLQDKNYAILAAMFRKRSYFAEKVSSRAGVFIWENFNPGHRDLGRKSRDLGNRASPASNMNTSKFLRSKEWRGEI